MPCFGGVIMGRRSRFRDVKVTVRMSSDVAISVDEFIEIYNLVGEGKISMADLVEKSLIFYMQIAGGIGIDVREGIRLIDGAKKDLIKMRGMSANEIVETFKGRNGGIDSVGLKVPDPIY